MWGEMLNTIATNKHTYLTIAATEFEENINLFEAVVSFLTFRICTQLTFKRPEMIAERERERELS